MMCLQLTPHLHTAVCWLRFILIVCLHTHIMLLIYSWFYTSWTLPEDEETHEIFSNSAVLYWLFYSFYHKIGCGCVYSRGGKFLQKFLSIDNLCIHMSIDNLCIHTICSICKVFLSQHDTNIQLYNNRDTDDVIALFHSILCTQSLRWVARHEKYTYFQGRDGGYNFSEVVKDMTLIRSNNVTDGIYVRFQWRILFYCTSVVSCYYRIRLSWWRCFKEDDDGWMVVESNKNLGMFLR